MDLFHERAGNRYIDLRRTEDQEKHGLGRRKLWIGGFLPQHAMRRHLYVQRYAGLLALARVNAMATGKEE